MKLRATFPVYRASKRRLEDNLEEFGNYSEHLVCKADNNRDLLAIVPKHCVHDERIRCTMCDDGINNDTCTGCLVCQIGIAQPDDGVDRFGVPSLNEHHRYDSLSSDFFAAKYITYPSTQTSSRPVLGRFNRYTGAIDERNFTNPLIASYLWTTSCGDSYVSCSPEHELSLDVSIMSGEREGHLDVVLRSLQSKKRSLLVGEGKRSVKAFLIDSKREQQKKYEKQIKGIGMEHGYEAAFSYIIGGDEDPMYPEGTISAPMVTYRKEFFEDVLRNNKKFISIHALRGLGVLYIATRGKACLERIVLPLLEQEDFCGLVLGGAVVRTGEKFALRSLSDLVSIG